MPDTLAPEGLYLRESASTDFAQTASGYVGTRSDLPLRQITWIAAAASQKKLAERRNRITIYQRLIFGLVDSLDRTAPKGKFAKFTLAINDMRIKPSDRVRYTKNPLQDVTSQVRFPPLLGLNDSLASKMQAALAKDFPIVQAGESLQVAISIGNQLPMASPPSNKAPMIYQFSSLDQQERVALARDSVTFSQTKYEGWEAFRAKLERVLALTAEIYEPSTVMRVGLRYRDVIDRDTLSISDASWRELLSPFVLGGLGTVDLFEDGDLEQHLKGTLTISDFELDGYSLQLRHGLATKQPENRQCFLIDGDYYASDARAFVVSDVMGVFERLHAGAGSVFRRCISDRLHNALEPVATTPE